MRLVARTSTTSTKAAAQAISIWLSNGEPEKLYINTASDAVGCIKYELPCVTGQ